MITIERHDIKNLEDYIKNIERYSRELKVREYELLENHELENVGAGKSNIPGNPIERESIKKLSDNRYIGVTFVWLIAWTEWSKTSVRSERVWS